MKEKNNINKTKVYNYKIVPPKYYIKYCLKCGGKFKTHSRNKRLCDSCKLQNDSDNNNSRVQKYYKKYGKNKNKIGTGHLKEHPLPPLKEIDAILEEMNHLNLI